METINKIGGFLPKWDAKVYIAIVLVVIIIAIVYAHKQGLLNRFLPESLKGDKSKKSKDAKSKSKDTKTKSKDKNKSKNSKSLMDAFTPEEESNEEEDTESDAEKLYSLVHSDFSNGTLTVDEFKRRAGDLADDDTFINLSQLYNITRQENKDPLTAITAKNYESLL